MVAKRRRPAEPPTFRADTPAWKRIKCALCGAEPGDTCRDLSRAIGGKIPEAGPAQIGKRAKPHDVRVNAAANASAGAL